MDKLKTTQRISNVFLQEFLFGVINIKQWQMRRVGAEAQRVSWSLAVAGEEIEKRCLRKGQLKQ